MLREYWSPVMLGCYDDDAAAAEAAAAAAALGQLLGAQTRRALLGLLSGLALVVYGTYLLCSLFIHVREANAFEDLHTPAHRQRVVRSVITTVLFVIVLLGFGFIALGHAGLVPVLAL